MTWHFVIGQNEPAVVLPTATGRQIDLRLRAPSTVKFSADARRPEISEILELSTDLFAYRDDDLVFRGVVGSTSDSIDADIHTVDVDAVDYRSRLSRVILGTSNIFLEDGVQYTNASDADIVWDLITKAQSRTGGNLGITRGANRSATTIRTEKIEAASSLFEAIEKFAKTDPGFDWTITPELTLEMWAQRGKVTDEVLSVGGNVASLTRSYSAPDYANAVRVTGNSGVNAVFAVADNIATAPEGRWETQIGIPEINNQAVLNARATKALADAQVAPEQFTLTMRPGWWQGVDHVDVGDWCRLYVKSGRLDIDRMIRVQDIGIGIGDDGDESVTLTAAEVAQPYLLRVHEVERRLRVLERR